LGARGYPHKKLLADYSTFGIGGPAQQILEIRSVAEMEAAIQHCRSTGQRWIVIGKGSNILFNDRGFDGVVLVNRLESFSHRRSLFEVGAGYGFARLGVQTARLGWSGLEFAGGIPGTVGGAVVMNAGADGAETADVLESVQVLCPTEGIQTLARRELAFGYRSSPFQEGEQVVLAAAFRLHPSAAAQARLLELLAKRKAKQPLREQSAGCVFRNPSQISAGALIEQCGLKGHCVGQAQVSTIHANFIVNRGEATCQQVLALIDHLKEVVKHQTGIELENEVRYVPF
jgi:UDP-N-acetylmuramate dehydrogenase